MVLQNELTWLIGIPFILNLLFNLAFTPLQFGLRNNFLASIDILLTLGTLIWGMVVIIPLVPWVAYINIPYLFWVSFATGLQLSITYLNL
jgi:translocator protein